MMNTSKDRIAVIMTVYNESELLLKASVDSILNQSYENIRFYILLDNPQNEKLRIVLSEYAKLDPRIKFCVNESNMGLVASLNKLLIMLDEEYIARMDADDIALPNRLELELEYLKKNNLDFVMSGIDYLKEDNLIEGRPPKELKENSFNKALRYGNISNHSTWLLKKSVYDINQGYRNIEYCEDYDFVLRAVQNGFRIGRMNSNLLQYRIRMDNISSVHAYDQFEKAEYLRKYYKNNRMLDCINEQYINVKFKMSERDNTEFSIEKKRVDDLSITISEGHYLLAINKLLFNMIRSRIYRKILRVMMINKIGLLFVV